MVIIQFAHTNKKIQRHLKYVEEKIKTLQDRKDFYENLQETLKKNEDNEISTTDPDAKMMDNKKNGLEVNYNVQIAADSKYNLIVANSSKGRVISRSKHQDFLDKVDVRTLENMDKYLKRQMIVEHPFGTIKRSMNAGYFLTRRLESVSGEADLIFLAYNMKRVINILGVKEIVKRIEARTASIYNKLFKYLFLSTEKVNFKNNFYFIPIN